MKHSIILAAVISFLVTVASAQVGNDTIQNRINSAHAEKSFTLTFDAAAGTSKLMAVSENFARDEAGRSGILAMNFAIGYIYAGDAMKSEPESFLLTFWVLTKKPQFGSNHSMTVVLREEMLVLGNARYAAKPSQQMEYLNFEISRENVAKIAGQSDVRFHLGDEVFTFTPSQMKLLADLVSITGS
jgi:hypothetical protein